ncbi:DgyrCDS3186 [Dimorphilus gyrociliatus]|uniref:DgyrCDS3186 n=1 Tax=Dimorphilus gyrociliatus TaxID=2664684 RepID=A0A7I8VCF1_9ANNE|nr:DgyrCDS3186 [Dimorphilus gyrociliatus]
MSLDFQKNVYHPRKDNARSRTTYTWMTRWNDFVPHDPINLYDEARKGRYRNLGARRRIGCDGTLSRATNFESDDQVRRPMTEFRYSKKSSNGTHPLGNPVVNTKDGATHLHYFKSGGYDDAHKSSLQWNKLNISPTYPEIGPPRLRNGNAGGSWRHVKQVLQPKGDHIVFIDGEQRIIENNKIMNRAVHLINTIQPSKLITADMRNRELVEGTGQALSAFKSTESGNWYVMR